MVNGGILPPQHTKPVTMVGDVEKPPQRPKPKAEAPEEKKVTEMRNKDIMAENILSEPGIP